MYTQHFVRGNQSLAHAPSIAGFYGVYTALAQEFSVSYNVRFSRPIMNHTKKDMWTNLRLEVANGYMPMQNLLQDIVTDTSFGYEQAIDKLFHQKVNTPSFVVLANGGSPTKHG